MSYTFLVTILGILAAIGLGSKKKIFEWMKFKQGAHQEKQKFVSKEINDTRREIVKKEIQIKDLESKVAKTKEIIETISKNSNSDIKKMIETPEIKKLLEEFNKW